MGRSENEFFRSSTGKVLRMIEFWFNGVPKREELKKILTVKSMRDFLT